MTKQKKQKLFDTPAEVILDTTGKIITAMRKDNRIHKSWYFKNMQLKRNKDILKLAIAGQLGHVDPEYKKKMCIALEKLEELLRKKKQQPRREPAEKQRGFTF